MVRTTPSDGVIPTARFFHERRAWRWVPVPLPCEHGPITENANHEDNHNGHDVEEPDDQVETENGFDRWRRESALGSVGTGIAKGLQNVFAPTDNQQVIVAEVPGDPPDADERVRVILDPDDPTKSVAYVPKSSEPEDGSPQEGGPVDQERPPS
jgi:hypothetical protein